MTNRDGYNQLQEFNEEEKYNSLLNSQNQFNPNNTGTNFYQNPNNVGGKTLIEDDNNNNLLSSGYKTNYIQSNRPKTSIKWRHVMKIDLDAIRNTNNLSLINNYLENFIYSPVTEDDIQAVPEGNIVKLIKILQFCNENLLVSRQNLSDNIVNLNGQKENLINEHQKLEEKLKNEKDSLDKYNRERKIRMKEIADYKNAVNALLQGGIPHFGIGGNTNITSIDINKNYNYNQSRLKAPMSGYKCKYCTGKIFSSEFELRKHLNDIHLITQFPDDDTNLRPMPQQIPQQINVTLPPLNNNVNNINDNNEKLERKLNEMKMEFQDFKNRTEFDFIKNQISRQKNMNNNEDDYKMQMERMGNTFNDTLKQILGVMVKNNQEKQKIIINPNTIIYDNIRNDEEINSLKNEIDNVNKMLEMKRKEYEEKKLKLKQQINTLTNQKLQINIDITQQENKRNIPKKIILVPDQKETISYIKKTVKKLGKPTKFHSGKLESDDDDNAKEKKNNDKYFGYIKDNIDLMKIISNEKKEIINQIKDNQVPINDNIEQKLRNIKLDLNEIQEGQDLEDFYRRYINRDQRFINNPKFERYLTGVLPNQFDTNDQVKKNAVFDVNKKLEQSANLFHTENKSKIPPEHKVKELVKEDRDDLIGLIKEINGDMESLYNKQGISDPYYDSVKILLNFDDIQKTVNMLDKLNQNQIIKNQKLRAIPKKVRFAEDEKDIVYFSREDVISGKEPGDIHYFSGGNALSEKEPGDIHYFSGGNALSGKEPGDIHYFSGGNALSGKEPEDIHYFSGGNALSGKEPGDIHYFSGGNALAGEKDKLKNSNISNNISDTNFTSVMKGNGLNNNLINQNLNNNNKIPDSNYSSARNGPNINALNQNQILNNKNPDSTYSSAKQGQNQNNITNIFNNNAADITYSSARQGPIPNNNLKQISNTNTQDVNYSSAKQGTYQEINNPNNNLNSGIYTNKSNDSWNNMNSLMESKASIQSGLFNQNNVHEQDISSKIVQPPK